MQYGFFDDVNKEYVITKPETPYPWINYLGNERFFSLISNTSGGYSFYKDPRLRRITRYQYNNAAMDSNGKYFFINDGQSVWSPSYMPMKEPLEFYECRHGLGYTSIKGVKNKLSVCHLTFVPLDFDGEVHKVTLTNTSNEKKSFTLFSYVEFCLWDALDDFTNFQRNLSIGEVEVEGSTIYHKTEYRERRNHYAFFHCNRNIEGFDTDRESFIGLYNNISSAKAVFEGQCTNSVASGWSPIAAHQINVTLAPKEKQEIVFILGYVENKQEDKFIAPNIINKLYAQSMIEKYIDIKSVDEGLAKLKDYWHQLCSIYLIESPDDKLNRMVNIWNPYQCMITFNLSRSASYFESGIGRGMGFRDSNQDILGFVHQVPERAKERLLDIAATQFRDGSNYHQYQPLTKKGNDTSGTGFNDDPLWMILSTAAYIKETGDNEILETNVTFSDDNSKEFTLYDHLKASFYHVVNNLGPHGLPLIGRADWNDCLNLNCFSETPGESFQTCANIEGRVAESVFIAGMFVGIGKEFVTMSKISGRKKEAEEAKVHINKMIKAVETHGFDGEWFLRAYDHYGQKVGSQSCEEGKIFIEPQGYCVMAGIGLENGMAKKALDSVEKHLNTNYGIVLNYPCYTKYHVNLGEISSYPPGYKENGGIFCHNNPWVAIAETELGRGDRAFDIYKKIAPAYLEEISEIHRTEPYVYAQMIAGKEAVRHGEAKNSWLTGTATWNYIAISQYILGIKPSYFGLGIDPCIPKHWDGYKIKRIFRGATYNITVKNPNHVSKGVAELIIDGNSHKNTNIIIPFEDDKIHTVEVIMG